MGLVTCDVTVSVDGFVAGPDQTLEQPLGRGGETLHRWQFEQPDVNASELAGILEFVTVAAGIAGTGLCSGTGIHAKFQPFGMNIVGKCFHSAGEKLWIRNELSVHTLF